MSRAAAIRVLLLAAVLAAVVALVRALRGGPTPAFSTPGPTAGTLRRSEPTEAADGEVRVGEPAAPVGSTESVTTPAPVTSPAPVTAAAAEPTGARTPNPPGERWVFADDGTCPLSHPIKAKLRSGLYHLPGMLAYERTHPDRCYATEVDAEADGLRRAKR